jgi:hypothetical protein
MYIRPASPKMFNEQISEMKLTKKYQELLDVLVASNSCFDTHDNCFQGSFREMVESVETSLGSLSRLFQYLRSKHLLKAVKDIEGIDRWMLDPRFFWNHVEHEYNFHVAMFIYGSHREAWAWLKSCRAVGDLFDPRTGEILGEFNTRLDLLYANSYSKSDRDKYRLVPHQEVSV